MKKILLMLALISVLAMACVQPQETGTTKDTTDTTDTEDVTDDKISDETPTVPEKVESETDVLVDELGPIDEDLDTTDLENLEEEISELEGLEI